MSFTAKARKEYSLITLNKIQSLDQTKSSFVSKQESAITDYDDTSADEYSNRQLLFDSIDLYTGALNELKMMDDYSFNTSNLAYKYLPRGNYNISSKVTDYSTANYREECSTMFNIMNDYSSSRNRAVINNSDSVYVSENIVPTDTSESREPIISDENSIANNLIIYKDIDIFNVKKIISAFNDITNLYYNNFTYQGKGIDYTNKNSYHILKYNSSALPLTFNYVNGTKDYTTNNITYSVVSVGGVGGSISTDILMNYPIDKYMVFSNSDFSFFQIGRITYSSEKIDSATTSEAATSTDGTATTTVTVTYTYNCALTIKILTDNDGTGKDTTLYPYKIITEQNILSVYETLRKYFYIAMNSCYSNFGNIREVSRIEDYDPLTNYMSIMNNVGKIEITSTDNAKWFGNYISSVNSDYLTKRKNILFENIRDTAYATALISAIKSRLSKDNGSLIQWYDDVLANDVLYQRWLSDINNNKPYFTRIAVCKIKVQPGEEVVETVNDDGTKTYETQKITDNKGNYIIYCENGFSDYYSRCGISASFSVGDSIYIMDDNKTETLTTINNIEYSYIPSGANINSSSTDSSIETSYDKVMKITCSNMINTDYDLDSNLRVMKLL